MSIEQSQSADLWCRRISNAAQLQICGPKNDWIAFSPCCLLATTPNDNVTVIHREDLDHVRKIFRDHIHSDRERQCSKCISRESLPNNKIGARKSPRQFGHEILPEDAKWGDIHLLDIRLDNRCNAACVTCGPSLSTLWQRELDMPIHTTQKSTQSLLPMLQNIVEDWSHIKRVIFSGGEPMLTDTHTKILEMFPDLSNVEIKYISNGSLFPDDECLKIWKRAKRINLSISLDGTGEQYNYIRFPLEWDSVSKNVYRLLDLFSSDFPTSEIGITCTVNSLNLLYIDNMDRWFNDLAKRYDILKTLEYGPCRGTAWDLTGAPPIFREKFLDLCGPDHAIQDLLDQETFQPQKFDILQWNLTQIDKRRNLDWRQHFPRAVELLI